LIDASGNITTRTTAVSEAAIALNKITSFGSSSCGV
jgi:hypothetical protein